MEEQLAVLSARIKELELQNASLKQQLKEQVEPSKVHKRGMKESVRKPQQKRFVALRIMYIGSKYHGFASQGCKTATVESELFAALERTGLLVGSIAEAKYSRCGRTDKGVSATYQVVALYLRSIAKSLQSNEADGTIDRVEAATQSRKDEEKYSTSQTEVEIDYVNLLNRALPDDIRVLGWCPVPPGFNARFSCLYREYKYFFFADGLDLNAMKQACEYFIGEHDFRNFCKMDAENVHNFHRRILSFDIYPINNEAAACRERHLWTMHVRGHAFLWHQIRCMAAVLFMVGQGLEQPMIVQDLLNLRKFPSKPQYLMAPEKPLVLRYCGFQGLNFQCRPESKKIVHGHLQKLLRETLMNAALITEGLELAEVGPSRLKAAHVPLMCRPTEPTYEERRLKFEVSSLPCEQLSI